MVPAGVCNLCFRHTFEQCDAAGGSCPLARVFCFHEHCNTNITWDDPTWNPEEDEWEYLGLCYGCIRSTSKECVANGGVCLKEEEGDDDYKLTSHNLVDVPILL